ncbi:MAG: hypothetical protein GXO72_06190 [Caldiserica bacterium]|nr:hypothetical protein [Caldisericota bacterium]
MRELLDWLTDPLAIAVLLLLFACGWAVWARRRWHALLIGAVAGGLYFLGIAPGADLLLRPLESAYPALLVAPRGEVAAVVVLAGGEAWGPERPITSALSEASLARLVEGIRVWRMLRGEVPLVFVGGVGTPGRPAEAPLVAKAAAALGVPWEAITWESSSRNTYENALAVKGILEGTRFVLVTSAFHMPRAMEVFRGMGLDPVPAPCGHEYRGVYTPYDYIPQAINLWHSAHALREYLAILWYRIRYR